MQRRNRIDRRSQALSRFEAAVELPLLILALAMIPLLVLPLVVVLPSGVDAGLTALEWFIWSAFAFEYVTRLVLTPARWRFVRREWPDLLIIVLPFLRPLRVVRSARALHLLRLGRLAVFLGSATRTGRRVLTRHGLHYAVLITLVVVVGAAVLMLVVEESRWLDRLLESAEDAALLDAQALRWEQLRGDRESPGRSVKLPVEARPSPSVTPPVAAPAKPRRTKTSSGEPNGWFVALAIPGFTLLIGGVLYVLQAILSSLNGSSSDTTVADHLRGGVIFVVVGGLLCAPLVASMRDDR